MLMLITDHLSALESVPTTPESTMYARTAPVKTTFSLLYAKWSAANARWKGETARFEAKLAELRSDKIELWDIEIQRVFRQGTADYTVLLPNRRGPFQKGAYEEIINEVESLALRLAEYSPNAILDAVRTDVENFHTSILAIRNTQQQKEQLANQASDQLEAARQTCGQLMFQNLGLFIDAYPNNPEQIENFYDLSLIQNGGEGSEEYSGILQPSEQKNVINSGLTQNSRLIIKNTGDAAFSVAIQPTPGSMGEEPQQLAPGSEIDTANLPEGLPNLPAYFLNLRNDSDAMEASYLVIVVN